MAFNPPPAAANKPKPAPEVKQGSDPKPKTPKSPGGNWTWGAPARIIVSLLVAFHLAAVFSAPWFIQLGDLFVPNLPPGTLIRDAQGRPIPLDQLSPTKFPPMLPRLPWALGYKTFRIYNNLLYINHGYDFFTPDPSVSHVLRFTVLNERGEEIHKGEFPNRNEQWPRLYYHRHMMLCDQSSDMNLRDMRWETRIAKRLLDEYNGDSVQMQFYVHHLLRPDQVKEGMALTDESTYELVGQMQQRRGEQLPGLPPLPGAQAEAVQATAAAPGGIPQ